MWSAILRQTIRRLMLDRVRAAITIVGLAMGLAGALLILSYVRYEQSYDGWLAGADRVFQVQSTIRPPGQPVVRTQASGFVIHDRLAADYPQVEAVTSVSVGKTVTERDGRPVFIEATTVDPTFFRVFPLPFREGSAATALADVNSIVLTEREARRWFGATPALGRTLTLGAGDGRRDYRVAGVLRDLPRNTNLRLSLVFPRDLNALSPEQRGWGNFDQQHFVRLRPGADVRAINASLPRWEERVIPTVAVDGRPAKMADVFDFRLVPIADVHLGETQEGALTPGGDPRALATFTVVALLALAMAVLNFVNLTTAGATLRAREVALRKLLGATRGRLAAQFFVESLLVCAAAMLLALAAAELAMPWLSRLLGADIEPRYLGPHGMLLPATGLFAATALVGASYPALRLTRVRPAEVLRTGRGPAETRGGGRLRGALVVVQFAIAIGLIASTAVIFAQTRFVERVDPGYRRDGLVQIANAWRFTQGAEYRAARVAMLAIPGVVGVGRTGIGLGSEEKDVRLVRAAADAPYLSMGLYGVDAEFLPSMEVGLLAGRLPGERVAADRIAGEATAALAARGLNVVVNRTAAERLGYRAPAAAVGTTMQVGFDGGTMVPATIVGVVADTRFRTARQAVEPMIFAYDPARTSQVVVRYAAARPVEVMAALEAVWRRFEPEIPFEARFVDDIVHELYAAERARTLLFAGFSLLAVVLACFGLYGLAAFATERRTKEIGIRKVLGARVRDIVRLLAWQFSRPVVLANLVAWPVAWWAMRDWLNGFDARIDLTPAPFLLASVLALAIALATVAGQALRAARRRPIDALRHE